MLFLQCYIKLMNYEKTIYYQFINANDIIGHCSAG